MKTAWATLSLAIVLAASPIAFAQDDQPDEATQIKELELRLNEVLRVEANGKVALKDEYKDSLPFPAERVQQMLGSFVEVTDGKIKIKNPDAIRAYLPMIRRFLSPESMERLREVQKLPPEQRADAMRRMFAGGGGGTPAPSPGATPQPPAPQPPAPQPQPPAPQPRPRAQDDEGARPHNAREREPLHRDRAAPGARQDEDTDDRLARLEHRLDRIERMLRDSLERRHDSRGPDRNADRGRGLRDLFSLFRRDRDRDREERRGGLGEMGRRARVWSQGLQKLSEIMEPDDVERLFAALERTRLQPGDLQDREQLMQKLQENAAPEDMARFMEIFSEFIATPEGRDFQEELERIVERLEGVVNSDRGTRLGDAMERFGGADLGELRERLEQLIRGRRGERDGARREEPRRGGDSPRREAKPRNLPEGAKLY